MIKQQVLLAPYTWFKTGGAAEFFCEPHTVEEFVTACAFARERGYPVSLLGEGANILISDAGIQGLVIKPCLQEITIHTLDEQAGIGLVTAGAGVSFADLITFCLQHQLGGLEEFSGIPGTVGGSVYINIHYFEFLLSHFLVQAHVLHFATGVVSIVDNDWFSFGYNQSRLQEKEYYLINATFKLTRISEYDQAFAHGRRNEMIRYRSYRYPIKGTCGSFFRNFFDHEVTLEVAGKKMIHVAYYLDKLGVKGALKVGDALVSHQHANMLVNTGNATSHDIISLARMLQERVFNTYGIIPQPECILWGFEPNILL